MLKVCSRYKYYYTHFPYAAVPSIPTTTTKQTDDLQTTAPPASTSPIPKSEDPVIDSGVNFQIIVGVVAVAMAILLFMVVVAMVILMVVVRKARLGKRVVMLGNTSPIDNPSYVIGMYLNKL